MVCEGREWWRPWRCLGQGHPPDLQAQSILTLEPQFYSFIGQLAARSSQRAHVGFLQTLSCSVHSNGPQVVKQASCKQAASQRSCRLAQLLANAKQQEQGPGPGTSDTALGLGPSASASASASVTFRNLCSPSRSLVLMAWPNMDRTMAGSLITRHPA